MDTEELAKIVEEIGELLPKSMTQGQLISFVLTVLHAYLDFDDVPELLRKTATMLEEEADGIREAMK